MEIRDIYVIIGNGFTKEKIVEDIRQEGYGHNFYFSADATYNDNNLPLTIAEEVWLFGNCDGKGDYILAKSLGKDLWKMA